MLALYGIGNVLDTKRLAIRHKLLYTWAFLQVISIASTIWLIVVQVEQGRSATVQTWDWVSSGFARAWVPYLLSYAASWTCYGYYCE
jgi:hypothetical protein